MVVRGLEGLMEMRSSVPCAQAGWIWPEDIAFQRQPSIGLCANAMTGEEHVQPTEKIIKSQFEYTFMPANAV